MQWQTRALVTVKSKYDRWQAKQKQVPHLFVLCAGCCKLVHHVLHTQPDLAVVVVHVLLVEVVAGSINHHLPAQDNKQQQQEQAG